MISQNYMRVRNLSNVLECIRVCENRCTKRFIQDETGLSWASVSGAINALLQKGFIVEKTDENVKKVGRPSMGYDINEAKNLFIGVDINIENIQIVLIDLKCRVVYSENKMLTDYDKDTVLNTVREMIRGVLTMPSVEPGEVKGIGFAIMSVVDTEKGVAVFSQHIRNWRNVKIKKIFENEFKIPVLVEHDPTCLAIAEMNIGHGKSNKRVIYLRLALGIGMSMMINGKIYKGSNGTSGEFGHMCMAAEGPVCSCGKKGCIEAYSSISGIAARYREDIKQSKGYRGISDRSVESDIAIINKLSKAAAAKDGQARKYFEDAAKMLGVGIGNLISLLNPDVIIMGGLLTGIISELYMDTVTETVNNTRWPFFGVSIVKSNIPDYGAAIGAAALFIHHKVWEDVI